MSGAEPVRVSPDEVTFGLLSGIPDDQLPMLAAEWLASGDYDSDLLREVAGMSRREGLDARRLFPELLASLGYEVRERDHPWDDSPWRGRWGRIAWCVAQMTAGRFAAYATAQMVLDVIGDVNELWEPGGGQYLKDLLARWDRDLHQRADVDRLLRAHLLSLRQGDVPPVGTD